MMNGRKTLLALLRRHRSRLGRLVLAGFALASFTISGAPCFAMANPTVHAAVNEGHHGHGHSGLAMGHADSAAATDDDGSVQEGLPHCPHCPPSAALPNHAASSDHAYCSAGDELADQTSFSATPSFAKYVLAAAAFEAPPPLAFHPPPRSAPRAFGVQHSAIALNLRNCVFLI